MSAKNSNQGAPIGQDDSATNSQFSETEAIPAEYIDSIETQHLNSPAELIRLQCEMYRSLLAIIPKPTADRIGERVGYLANGAILPGTGVGDLFTMAAMLGLSPDAIAAQVTKGKLPQLGLGRAILYSFSGLFKARK